MRIANQPTVWQRLINAVGHVGAADGKVKAAGRQNESNGISVTLDVVCNTVVSARWADLVNVRGHWKAKRIFNRILIHFGMS